MIKKILTSIALICGISSLYVLPVFAQTPSAPVLNSATAGNTQVSLSWSAPSNDGGSAIQNYRVSVTPQGGSETLYGTGNTNTSYTVTGLVNGTQYTFKVQARNSLGNWSSFSNTLTATPTTGTNPPGAPVLNTATAGDTEVALAWTAPSDTGSGAITGYNVSITPTSGGSENVLTIGVVTSYTVTGLTNSTQYTFKVRARNTFGGGTYSNTLNATPTASVSTPSAPSAPSLTRGNGTIDISWSAPNNGGSAITGYTVSYTASGQSEQTASINAGTTSYQLTGLTGGTIYSIKVRAANSAGAGPYSSTSTITAAETPTTPSALEIAPGDGTLALSWTSSSGNGDSVTNYIVWYRDEVTETITEVDTESMASSYVINGLVNGRSYTVKVKAENTIGESSYSAEKLVAPDINADPVLVGTPNVIPTSTGATITWSTNKSMSSWIDYGLISTAVSTTEYNTKARVTEHTVVLSNLLPCTVYTYKVYSRDAVNTTVTSSNKTFTTTGCPLSAPVLATERDSVVVADGGVLDFRTSDIKAKFTIPSEVTCLCSVMTVQAKKLDKTSVTTSIDAPDQKTWLGEHIYNFTAYKDEDETIEEFDLPVDVTIEYTENDIAGIDIGTLGIYHYDENSDTWNTLTDCTNNYNSATRTGTITCQTMSFSTFILGTIEKEDLPKQSLQEKFTSFWQKIKRPLPFKKFSRCEAIPQ